MPYIKHNNYVVVKHKNNAGDFYAVHAITSAFDEQLTYCQEPVKLEADTLADLQSKVLQISKSVLANKLVVADAAK